MVTKEEKKRIIKRTIIILLILIGIIGLIFGLYYGLGLNEEFSNSKALIDKINSYGAYSRVIYVIINFIQTTIIPITNQPTIIAGTKIFGPVEASILTCIGVLLGSITSFSFGKLFGKKAVDWVIGKDAVDKYLSMAKGRENYVIFSMLLLPGFPDDIICIVAGITSMTWSFFLITILITRTIPTFLIAFISDIIPFSGWGLLVWALIFIVFFFVGMLISKLYNRKIEAHTHKEKEKIS